MALSKEYAQQLKRSKGGGDRPAQRSVSVPDMPEQHSEKRADLTRPRGDDAAGLCHACGQSLPVIDLSNIDVRKAAAVTDRSERQVYRWKSGEARPDSHALAKLKEAGWL